MWRRLLSHRWSGLILAVIGMLLILPTVNVGFIADDFFVGELLTGKQHAPHPGAFFGLFTFVDGQSDRVQHLKDIGQVPWWVADNARLAFWRPLAEVSHWLDYQLWPQSPMMMHVQTVLWYGLLVWLLARLYRMLDANATRSGLAALIFAMSTMHLLTVVWLAARNQLMAGCFLLITLMCFHKWRQGQGWRYGAAAMLAFALGLLSAEAAIATMAYLTAHVVVLAPQQSWAKRLKALMPFLIMVVAWRLLYNHLGYGSTGSGGYIDPAADPLRFAQALQLRLPTLLMAHLFGASSSTPNLLSDPAKVLYAWGAAAAVAACIGAGQIFGLWSKPLARFHGLGALLALVPVCAAETNDRLLLNAEFGLSALLAMLFMRVLAHRERYLGWLAGGAKVLVAALMFVHLLVYPVATVTLSTLMHALVQAPTRDEPMSLPDAGRHSQSRVLLLNPPNALFVGYYPVERRYFGASNALSTQALASGNQALKLTVVDERTLVITGPLGIGESLSRDFRKQPFKVGDQVRAGQFVATVEEVTPYGKAKTARFRFDTALHEPHWQIYAWGKAGYEPFVLPAVGQSVTLNKSDLGPMVSKRVKATFDLGKLAG